MLPLLLSPVLLLGPVAPQQGVPHGIPARIEVLDGRAVLALSSGVIRLTESSPPQSLEGPLHLEVAPNARVRVRWSAAASLLLEGRAILEWGPLWGLAGESSWRFSAVERAHLEIRRGRVLLALPLGWSAQLEGGACFVAQRPDGQVELHHDAGLPILLWPPHEPGRPVPPLTVLAGAHLRLSAGNGRPLALHGTQDRLQEPHGRQGLATLIQPPAFSLGSWRGFAWPWRPAAPEPLPVAASSPFSARLAAPDLAPSQPAAEASQASAGNPPLPDEDPPRGTPPAAGTDGGAAGATAPPASKPPGSGSGEGNAQPLERAPVRRHGVLILTPYGVRWVDRAPPSPARPSGARRATGSRP